jgi:ribosomal-protein-alanine N-acetyltransferase
MSSALLRATTAHAAWLEQIHALAFSADDAWDAEVFATQLDLPGMFGLIAEDQGFVLTRVAADEAEILTICVAPAARRQGAARKLLAGAEKIASAWGATSMFLEVSTYNYAAFDLYKNAGYERVGLRKRYYSDGSDGVILRKII